MTTNTEKRIEILNKYEEDILEIVDDCMSDWSYIEEKYHKKFKELKKEIAKLEGKE